MKIAFTTHLPAEGFGRLQDSRYELYAPWEEAEVLVATFDYRVTREMLEQMPRLKLVCNFGVGFNNIDLDCCRERHIGVTNTPKPVVEPTAELAFALMICLARRVATLDRQLREGTAEPFGVMNNLSHSLYGKTLGIVGLGNIGKALARRAEASGMRIIYTRRSRPTEPDERYRERLEDLLREADFVSLNLPYTPAVHHLIGERELGMMKPTVCLINTARGAHVDEEALVRALQNGTIAGAAMDVYEHEPNISPELLRLDNVVLSPHTGTGTWEGRLAMCENVVDNILLWESGERERMDWVLKIED